MIGSRIYYFIDEAVFSKEKIETVLNTTEPDRFLLFVYDLETKVIQDLELLITPYPQPTPTRVTPPLCNETGLFIDTSDTTPHAVVDNLAALKKAIENVYQLDCCMKRTADCFVFKNSFEGCEARALRLTKYFDLQGIDYDLLGVERESGETFYACDERGEYLKYRNHLALGLKYGTATNYSYIVIDPTLFNTPTIRCRMRSNTRLHFFLIANGRASSWVKTCCL